jgi:hypothetical protein
MQVFSGGGQGCFFIEMRRGLGDFGDGFCWEYLARWRWFFVTEISRRERKVLCLVRVAGFEIGTQLLFGSLLERLRGGRLLFPLRRTSSPKRGDFFSLEKRSKIALCRADVLAAI